MSNTKNNRTISVVVIATTGHSGGTWLNLMLGAHPEIIALGELSYANGLQSLKGACSLCGEGCEFWDKFDQQWNPDENIFLQLAEFTGKHRFAISTWNTHADHLADERVEVKCIRLLRNGIATTASYYRKYPNRTFTEHIQKWVHDSIRVDRWLEQFSAENTYIVRYEDLLENSDTLSSICHFLNIDYIEDMNEYWKVPQHILGGNRGTLFFMRKYLGLEITSDQEPVDSAFYINHDPLKFRDQRYQKELTRDQLIKFEQRGGSLNRTYGYSQSLKGYQALYLWKHRIASIFKKLRKSFQ
jgi:hypothetical protein